MSKRHRGIVMRASTTSTYQRRWSTATGGMKWGHNWKKTLWHPKGHVHEGSRFKTRRTLRRQPHALKASEK